MDPRSNKARDFVACITNLREEIQKIRLTQIKWLQKFEWLLDEHTRLKGEIKQLRDEKCESVVASSETRDKKTCLPAPVTTSGEYGWLAVKPDFRLEKYGSFNPEYPDPLKDVIPLRGKIPILAPGKGYIR